MFKKTTTETEVVDLELKKSQLLAEVSFIGSKIEEANALLSVHTITKQNIEDLKKEFQDLNTILVGIRSDLVTAKSEHQTYTSLIEHLRHDHLELGESKATLIAHIELLKKDKPQLEREIDSLKAIISTFQNHRKDIENEVSTVKAAAEKYKEEKKRELDEINKAITDSNVSFVQLVQDYEKVKNELSQAKSELIQAQKELADSKDQLVVLSTEHQNKKAAFESEIAVKNAAHEARTKQLEEREGDVSLKESWINDKETNLKATKLELEKFYGRKINSVQF